MPLFAQQFWMSTVAVPDAPTSNHAHSKLAGAQGSIVYTETDEAPALATYSLYPAVAKVCILPSMTVVSFNFHLLISSSDPLFVLLLVALLVRRLVPWHLLI
jgi:hypothetical protein